MSELDPESRGSPFENFKLGNDRVIFVSWKDHSSPWEEDPERAVSRFILRR